ncbi:MAG: DUF3868 domain-containing protein [Alistipes sp.]|jgi:hypothetical protein|nr:DUF3868 domain-containing protein [Alistipes sp.]
MKNFRVPVALAAIVPLLCFAAFAPLAVRAQSFDGGISASGIALTPLERTVLLDMALEVADSAVTERQGVAVVPYLSDGVSEAEFPSVLVNGKSRNRIYERQTRFGNTGLSENAPTEVMVVDRKHPGGTIDYSASIAREEWMDGASLGIRFVLVSPAGEMQYLDGATTGIRMPPALRAAEVPAEEVVAVEPQPEAKPEPAPVKSRHSISGVAGLDLVTGDARSMRNFRLDPQVFSTLSEEVDGAIRERGARIVSVEVTGYASPDGPALVNEGIALERAKELAYFLRDRYGIAPTALTVGAVGEDWKGLREMVAGSDLPYVSAVLEIIDGTESVEQKEVKLRKIMGGGIWRRMSQTMLPELRRVEYLINYEAAE